MRQHQLPGCSYPRIKILLALSLYALLEAGCAVAPHRLSALPGGPASSPSVTQINSALVSAAQQAPLPTADYRIGAEDVLEITLYNISESDTKIMPRMVNLR